MKNRISTLVAWIGEVKRNEYKEPKVFEIGIPKQEEEGIKSIRFSSNSVMPNFVYFKK